MARRRREGLVVVVVVAVELAHDYRFWQKCREGGRYHHHHYYYYPRLRGGRVILESDVSIPCTSRKGTIKAIKGWDNENWVYLFGRGRHTLLPLDHTNCIIISLP